MYEYGDAIAHTDALISEQIIKAKEISPIVKIYNYKEHNFAILEW